MQHIFVLVRKSGYDLIENDVDSFPKRNRFQDKALTFLFFDPKLELLH